MVSSPQLNPPPQSRKSRSPTTAIYNLRSNPATSKRLSFSLERYFTFPLLILTFVVAILTYQAVEVNSTNLAAQQINEYGGGRDYADTSKNSGGDEEDSDLRAKLMAKQLTGVLINATVPIARPRPSPSSLPPTDAPPTSSSHQTESLSASPPSLLLSSSSASSSATTTTPSPLQVRSTTPKSLSSHPGSGSAESVNVSAQAKHDSSTASQTTTEIKFPQHETQAKGVDADHDHNEVTSTTKLGNGDGNDSDTNEDNDDGDALAGKSKRHVQTEDKHHIDEESYHKTYGACRKALLECFDQLPRSPINAIPSTEQDLSNSCRSFEKGVNCFNNVSSKCFEAVHREHLIMDIHAEYEILKFLCYNNSFRVSCLPTHTPSPSPSQPRAPGPGREGCYNEVADRWNNCTRTQMLLHAWKKSEDFCCIKITLTECVSGGGGGSDKSEHNTTRYLESMSRTYVELLRRENNLTRADVEKCAAVKSEACVRASDNKPNNGAVGLVDVHQSDDTNANAHAEGRASQNKRNSMQDHYPYEFDDDEDEDNDGHHHHYHDGKNAGDDDKGKAMTKLSSAKNAAGNDGKGGPGKKKPGKCSEALDKCIEQIPPMPDAGIPSTLQGVKNACRAFHNGTDCINRATKDCLNDKERQQVRNSILGAHETFTFLCTDEAFRNAYLKHGSCYNKISKHWDNCVRKFISALRQLKDSQKSMEVCCLRMAFLHCVMDVTNRYCDHNATQFMRLLSETLIRSTMHSHMPNQCLTVKREHCPIVQNSAGRFGPAVGRHEGSSHRFAWILGRVVLSLTMMDLVTFYYTRFITI